MEDTPSGATVIPLRRRLLVLTVAGVLPLAVIAGLGLYALAAQQRADARRVGIELARSVATAADAQLSSSGDVLEALSTTLTLDRGDLAGFGARARRVLELQPGWAAIRLAEAGGKPLVDTRVRAGDTLPSMIGQLCRGGTHAQAGRRQPRARRAGRMALPGAGAGRARRRAPLRRHRARQAR